MTDFDGDDLALEQATPFDPNQDSLFGSEAHTPPDEVTMEVPVVPVAVPVGSFVEEGEDPDTTGEQPEETGEQPDTTGEQPEETGEHAPTPEPGPEPEATAVADAAPEPAPEPAAEQEPDTATQPTTEPEAAVMAEPEPTLEHELDVEPWVAQASASEEAPPEPGESPELETADWPEPAPAQSAEPTTAESPEPTEQTAAPRARRQATGVVPTSSHEWTKGPGALLGAAPPAVPTMRASQPTHLGELPGRELDLRAIDVNPERIASLEPDWDGARRTKSFLVLALVVLAVAIAVATVSAVVVELIGIAANHAISQGAGS